MMDREGRRVGVEADIAAARRQDNDGWREDGEGMMKDVEENLKIADCQGQKVVVCREGTGRSAQPIRSGSFYNGNAFRVCQDGGGY